MLPQAGSTCTGNSRHLIICLVLERLSRPQRRKSYYWDILRNQHWENTGLRTTLSIRDIPPLYVRRTRGFLVYCLSFRIRPVNSYHGPTTGAKCYAKVRYIEYEDHKPCLWPTTAPPLVMSRCVEVKYDVLHARILRNPITEPSGLTSDFHLAKAPLIHKCTCRRIRLFNESY